MAQSVILFFPIEKFQKTWTGVKGNSQNLPVFIFLQDIRVAVLHKVPSVT